MKWCRHVLLLATALGLLSACNSNPSQPSPPAPTPVGTAPPSSPGAADNRGGTPSAPTASADSGEDSGEDSAQGRRPKSASSDAGSAPSAGDVPRSGGPSESAGAPEPTDTASSPETPAGAARGGAEGSARTEAERAEDWNQAFDVSLGEFDERLQRERAEIEQAGAGGGSGQEQDGGGQAQTTGDGVNTAGMPAELPVDESGSAAARTGAGGGYGQSGPRFPAPEGTPSGADDDVVARQLREAAEREQDPELRKKLWEEYRKYKSRKG